jgi:uncharacterized iron-regulated membrane protein
MTGKVCNNIEIDKRALLKKYLELTVEQHLARIIGHLSKIASL